MLIGLISDTHNQADRTTQAFNILEKKGIEALIHCGDLTRSSIAQLLISKSFPSYFVYGNNDDPRELGLSIKAFGGKDLGFSGLITLRDRRIGVTHGDRPSLMQKLAAESPDYLFFGHSHLVTDFQQGPTRFINPGALHRAPRWTFATLNLADGQIEWHQLKED